MIPPPPRSTLFPYTTLFRSQIDHGFTGTIAPADLAVRVSALADGDEAVAAALRFHSRLVDAVDALEDRPPRRSEERRVGKEGRSRGWPDHLGRNTREGRLEF